MHAGGQVGDHPNRARLAIDLADTLERLADDAPCLPARALKISIQQAVALTSIEQSEDQHPSLVASRCSTTTQTTTLAPPFDMAYAQLVPLRKFRKRYRRLFCRSSCESL